MLALPTLAWADHTDPLKIALTKLKCLEETDDGPGDDEIYVVAFVSDLTAPLAPNSMTFKTKVLQDVDDGTRHHHMQIWGLNGRPAPIDNRNDVVILVALMEHDSSNPASVKDAVQAGLAFNVVSYKRNGVDRATLVGNLRSDMNGAIDLGKQSGQGLVSNGDERLGSSQELRLTANDLRTAQSGGTVTKTLEYRGDGGHYRLYFNITKS
jgi:hypothetical protein